MAGTNRLLTIEQVMRDYLPLGRTKLYEEIRSGRIPVVKIGRRTFISEQALEAYIDGLPVGP